MNSGTTETTPGTFGSGTTIPQITVDAKGRITSVATVAASSSSSQTISDGTNTDAVTAGTDTLTFSGGEGIVTAVTNNTVTISAEDATASNKGIASFDETDFDVNSGDVTIATARIQSLARGSVGVGGSLAYDSSTGVMSFTERTDSEVRGLFSASGDISYDSTTGAFSFTNDAGDIESVDAGTGLSGGGSSGAVTLNVSGLTVSEFAGGSIQLGTEAFSDSDSVLMTAAAVED